MQSNKGNASRVTLELLKEILQDYHPRNFEIVLWDGKKWEAEEGVPVKFRLILNHPGALRNMFSPPTELNLGESYIYGDFDIEGDIEGIFPVAEYIKGLKMGILEKLKLGSKFLSLPKDERPIKQGRAARLRGKLHSIERDKMAIRYHYDVSNDFFKQFLDKNMVYSCAYFKRPDDDLDKAQLQKLNHIARKLFLKSGEKILDIGCGWGSFIVFAVQRYGVKAVGITLSEKQYEYAKEWIHRLGIQDDCKVELKDYREVEDWESFDKLVSIGMFEHVGEVMLEEYFRRSFKLLKPGGLFLNHGIAKRATDPKPKEETFSQRYVFPDGELVPISTTLKVAEGVGFEVRDVESLREHYAMTLRRWVKRLEKNYEDAKKAADEVTYRIWRLFMSGSQYGFEVGRLNVYQSLLLKPGPKGESNLPLTRDEWYKESRE